MIHMSQRKKHLLVVLAVVMAFGLAGYMDEQDAHCSWNGCGPDRYKQE